MKRVVVSVVLAILGTMAFAQSRGVVDGGYAASKSFGAQSAMLKEKFGIELTIPEGFVDRTFGTSKSTLSATSLKHALAVSTFRASRTRTKAASSFTKIIRCLPDRTNS